MANHKMSARDKKRRRKALIKRDGELCQNCGNLNDLTLGHKKSRGSGGGNNIENLHLLCDTCNQRENIATQLGY